MTTESGQLSGDFVAERTSQSTCTATLFRDRGCRGESRSFSTARNGGEQFELPSSWLGKDDAWKSLHVSEGCHSVELYDEDEHK